MRAVIVLSERMMVIRYVVPADENSAIGRDLVSQI
jgi:hypothetical protein